MARSSIRRWWGGALLLGAVSCALVSAQAAVGLTSAAPDDRAVVLVDDGVRRRAHCVVFDGEISGLEALRATGSNLVLDGFGSMGSAVCSIDGVGCSASSCLTCQLPDFWRYFRAGSGDAGWQLSGAGGSTVRVRDGDRQAWVWGARADPGAVPSVDAVCGPRPPTTTRPTPTVAPAPAPTPAPAQPDPAPAPPPAAAPPASPGDLPSSPGDPGTTASTTALAAPDPAAGGEGRGDDEGDDRPDDRDRAESPVTEDTSDFTIVPPGGEQAAGPDQGVPASEDAAGGWWGVALVGAVLAGFAGWVVRIRRRAAT